MESLKLNFIKVLLLLFFINIYGGIEAQTKGIIIDSKTKLPIPYVSVYTKGKNVKGCMGNEFGEYSVNFKYDTLFFSHINYELTNSSNQIKIDTIFMNPTEYTMPEFVITANNSKWIETILKDVVKYKLKNYQAKQTVMEYEFDVKSIGDSSGYAFSSKGNMISPEYSQKEGYKICPVSNVIKYKDKTAGRDFMQLRRCIYNNFIKNFDNKFIKSYEFAKTSFKDEKNNHLMKFSFKSKKDLSNSGYIVVDTLKKVITEFEQVSGTEYNINSNTNSIGRMVALQYYGFKYTIWHTVIKGCFSLINGSFQLTDCQYQFYRQNEYKVGKQAGTYFTNIESHLTMKEGTKDTKKCDWINLTNPRSITLILSKKTRLSEEALNRTHAVYELF